MSGKLHPTARVSRRAARWIEPVSIVLTQETRYSWEAQGGGHSHEQWSFSGELNELVIEAVRKKDEGTYHR